MEQEGWQLRVWSKEWELGVVALSSVFANTKIPVTQFTYVDDFLNGV